MLLKVLRDIFSPDPSARLPADEAALDRQMHALVDEGRPAAALALYDAAVANGLEPRDGAFESDYRSALEATGTPPFPLRRRVRFHRLCALLRGTDALDGDVAECGCFRGLSSFLLLSTIARSRPGYRGEGYHVFDSFQGLGAPGAEDRVEGHEPGAERIRRMCQPGWFAAPEAEVRRNLSRFPAVAYHPGWIPASLGEAPERRYRFVHLDLDLYEPTLAALEYFFPRLVAGAALVCDDYGWPGGRRAVDRFCAERHVAADVTPDRQAILRKPA